jgi:hypothetical protein
MKRFLEKENRHRLIALEIRNDIRDKCISAGSALENFCGGILV